MKRARLGLAAQPDCFERAGRSGAGAGYALNLEITVTGTRRDTNVAPDDTASAGTITAPDTRGISHLPRRRDARNVPGLIVTQHSGEGKANQYFLRGFNLDHGTDIAISLDDVPVNMRTHGHGQGYADLNFMIPELISDIPIARARISPTCGDFDTAGAVQINYVDTLPHDLASLSAGSFGDYRGFAAASRPWGAGNLLVADRIRPCRRAVACSPTITTRAISCCATARARR